MKIVFVSNVLNHHQLSFCQNLCELCDSFFFIATDPSEEGHGYQSTIESNFVIHWFDAEQRHLAEEEIIKADAVIFGACPSELISLRMKCNKLSFFYAERFFKKGTWRRFIPTTYKKVYNSLLQYRNKRMYVLAASAYLPYDLSLLCFPLGKIYKWGYFPELREHENTEELIGKKNPHSIVWVARFIDWKHPETAINIAKRLKSDGYDFEMNLIGNGELFHKISEEVKIEQLDDNVRLLGSMKPEQVREYMEKSEIHIFTSDRNEGWGAVLNESMNSACVPVANKAIGSVPYLINDGNNGFMYKDENELYEKVKYLLNNDKDRKAMANRAYDTISTKWNAKVAAERFVETAKRLLNGENIITYDDGPCCFSKVIKDNW